MLITEPILIYLRFVVSVNSKHTQEGLFASELDTLGNIHPVMHILRDR